MNIIPITKKTEETWLDKLERLRILENKKCGRIKLTQIEKRQYNRLNREATELYNMLKLCSG